MGDLQRERDFDGAFAPLFHEAFGVTFRILGDVDAAEEAALDALTQARLRWRRVHDLPYRDAWVMRAAANAAIARIRTGRTPESADADNAALHAAVVNAMVKLPRRQRDVMALRYVAGLGYDEVAECLGISVEAVKHELLAAATGLGDRVGRRTGKAETVAG